MRWLPGPAPAGFFYLRGKAVEHGLDGVVAAVSRSLRGKPPGTHPVAQRQGIVKFLPQERPLGHLALKGFMGV